ncbi:MAG: membrane protein insertase YidC [Proteobacteria bacterium]|nr:membrane protein insertase YidC [Pseudomonadota bacterium]
MNRDNIRLLLLLALGFVLFLIWEAWQQDHAPQPQSVQTVTPAAPGNADVPVGRTPTSPATAQPQTAPGDASAAALPSAQRVHVVTDVLDVEIDTVGGDLRRLDMLAYPAVAGKPEPFRLMTEAASKLFVAQTGLLAGANGPDHHAQFKAEQAEYRLESGANELKVRLRWVSPEGVPVDKVYTFSRGSYEVKIEHQVHNTTPQELQGRVYGQFQRVEDTSSQSHFIYTYTGGVISSPENKYEKIDFGQMAEQNLSRDIVGGWAAMLQHYFVSAWIPPQDETSHYYTTTLKEGVDTPRYILGLVSTERSIKPGESATLGLTLYVGPKIQDHLKEVAPNLDLTVDYGMLTVLAQPLFWLLEYIHGVVNNWGWSIVLLTLLIKLVFYHLSAASYRSMANMRKLQPRIMSIRERLGDDRQRMSQAMMELYKTEKINPLGGCLPVLVQIPVFIALYWVLLESVELRQADFIFWLTDLSGKDPYYVLPLLMGATMFIQMKLSPPPPDPLQAKVMMALPFIFTFFFAFFPSGLVLYWVVNNAISILQQWHITRKIISS